MSKLEFDIAEMRARLASAITSQRRTPREVSLSAGLSDGYLRNILERGQSPTIEKLQMICDELDVSVPFIMYGVDFPAEYRPIFDLMNEDPKKFRALLELLS